ncbi:hypothetical protein RRG08_027856 [Elysia crispata]|uniref:Uncharacterized protein n=1 Tax=Elysia crispata TaxID=231223 RepID=A0AAE0YTE7_9GAST|nr:hypothetical protein RRG08_027856 [Elysia crispata]
MRVDLARDAPTRSEIDLFDGDRTGLMGWGMGWEMGMHWRGKAKREVKNNKRYREKRDGVLKEKRAEEDRANMSQLAYSSMFNYNTSQLMALGVTGSASATRQHSIIITLSGRWDTGIPSAPPSRREREGGRENGRERDREE